MKLIIINKLNWFFNLIFYVKYLKYTKKIKRYFYFKIFERNSIYICKKISINFFEFFERDFWSEKYEISIFLNF